MSFCSVYSYSKPTFCNQIFRTIFCSMIKLLFGLCRQRASVSLINLPINISSPYLRTLQALLRPLNTCKPISSICSLYLNCRDSSKKVTDSMTSKASGSSSPEVVEQHSSRGSKEAPHSSLNQKRKRKTVAESLKDNVRKWEASHGKKRGKSSSENSPNLVALDSADSDVEVIEVVPRPKMHRHSSGPQQGLYSPSCPLSARQWHNTRFGTKVQREGLRRGAFPFSVMSYNVLAQELLEQHPYLYERQDPAPLQWGVRHEGLMREIRHHLPDVICLQEVQASHLGEFFQQPLSQIGYEGIFKQRTGNKVDGCAIFWQRGKFRLLEETSVEFFQPRVRLLDRDNIALVARLGVRGAADEVVAATTHLLYNPRRADVRLAQVQLLLAELDRLSHGGRLPVILSGDFNLTPHSSVYQLLAQGRLDEGAGALGPLGITDCCRHAALLTQRPPGRPRNLEMVANELSLLRLHHSQRERAPSPPQEAPRDQESGDGTLRHALRLGSAYQHHPNVPPSEQQATTHQNNWVTVDYIFFSLDWAEEGVPRGRRRLSLLSRWSLPSVALCEQLGGIPNHDAPSDHLPLVACFLLS